MFKWFEKTWNKLTNQIDDIYEKDLKDLTKIELEKLGREKYGIELDRRKRKETLIQNKELALISKKLVTLKDDVPVKEQIEEFFL